MVRLLVATGELLDIVYGEQLAPIAMAALKTILAEGWRPEWDWSQLSGVDSVSMQYAAMSPSDQVRNRQEFQLPFICVRFFVFHGITLLCVVQLS